MELLSFAQDFYHFHNLFVAMECGRGRAPELCAGNLVPATLCRATLCRVTLCQGTLCHPGGPWHKVAQGRGISGATLYIICIQLLTSQQATTETRSYSTGGGWTHMVYTPGTLGVCSTHGWHTGVISPTPHARAHATIKPTFYSNHFIIIRIKTTLSPGACRRRTQGRPKKKRSLYGAHLWASSDRAQTPRRSPSACFERSEKKKR